jgi:hypothetical protein
MLARTSAHKAHHDIPPTPSTPGWGGRLPASARVQASGTGIMTAGMGAARAGAVWQSSLKLTSGT